MTHEQEATLVGQGKEPEPRVNRTGHLVHFERTPGPCDAGTVTPRADWTAPETDVRLELTVDSPALSPIDGTAELPADGKAQATITVRKRSLESDRDLTGAQHDNLLTIRTTAGTLSRRQVSLRRGKAKFTLRSSVETVVAEVRVSAETIPQAATIRVEFAPPD
jgi:hypothetical protein